MVVTFCGKIALLLINRYPGGDWDSEIPVLETRNHVWILNTQAYPQALEPTTIPSNPSPIPFTIKSESSTSSHLILHNHRL